MDPKLQQQIDEMEVKISEIYVSTRKTERYIKLTFWVTVGVVVLPMLIAAFIVPVVMSKYLSMYEGLL